MNPCPHRWKTIWEKQIVGSTIYLGAKIMGSWSTSAGPETWTAHVSVQMPLVSVYLVYLVYHIILVILFVPVIIFQSWPPSCYSSIGAQDQKPPQRRQVL